MTELQILRTTHPPKVFLDQMVELNTQVGRSVSSELLLTRIEALPRDDRLLLAVEGDFLVGFAHLSVHKDLSGQDSVEILDLIVRKANRRRGIGRRLVNAAETWARQSKHAMLLIRAREPDSIAQAFLIGLHFEQRGTEVEFVRTL